MSFTLAQLKTAIQDYTQNTETSFVTNLPVFIRQAEERILKNVQLTFSLSFVDSSSNHVFLDYKDVNFVQEFNPNSATTGNPRYYALFDDSNFIIGPTPNSNYVAELHYFYRPNSLTAGSESGTTWLSENAQTTLLYGCLIEAYTYMKGEPDVMQEYEKRFAEGVVAMKNFGEAKEVTDAYRTGLVIRDKT